MRCVFRLEVRRVRGEQRTTMREAFGRAARGGVGRPAPSTDVKLALQACGRKMSHHISRRRKEAEAERKRSYIEKYIPHIGIGLREILGFGDREETRVVGQLTEMLQKSRK